MNAYERQILDHIERHGCSVTSVFDPDGVAPPFTYSIGITKTTGAPELIVVGLESDLAHWLVNEYKRRTRKGETFEPGVPYAGFLEGFDVRFGAVSRGNRERYMRSACWLHGGPDFEALQLIWPSTTGTWPWDPDEPGGFWDHQPLLSGPDGEPDSTRD